MHLILVGPTNAGKSTQAQRLERSFPDEFSVVDVGEILRNRALQDDAVGAVLRDAMSRGEYAPVQLVTGIWIEEAKRVIDQCKHCVLVFSRLSAEFLESTRSTIPPEQTCIVLFANLTEELLISRAHSRARFDDDITNKRKRIQAYESGLQERLNPWIWAGYRIKTIDASASPDRVFESLRTLIDR